MRKTLLGAVLLAAAAMTTACEADGGTAKAPDGGRGGAAPVVTTPAAPPATTPPASTPPATTPPAARPKPATTTPERPASYDPERDTTDLAISTPGLVLAQPVDGVRHGTLVVTVQNKGPNPVWGLRFGVELPASFTADGGDWAGCTRLKPSYAGYPAGSICDKGYLASGASRTYRLRVESPAAKDGADGEVSRWLVDVWSGGPKDSSYRDRSWDDNRDIFSITRR